MKSYSMLSVLWLVACGAAAEPSVDGDSRLKQSLGAPEDEASDSDPIATPEDEASDSDPVATPDDDTDGAPCGDEWTDGDGATGSGVDPQATQTPVLVVGAAPGEAWPVPANGTVVWCNADVVVGCPAIEPTPRGGRLIVVEAGGVVAPVGAGAAAAGSVELSTTVPVPDGTAPLPELPVIVGGTLPPLPGTCVAVDVGAMPSAEQDPTSAAPVIQGEDRGTDPAAGTARAALTAGTATPVPTTDVDPVPGVPALLPLPGNCFGVTLPPSPPRGEATPVPVPPTTDAVAVPAADPDAEGCFGIAFAQPAGGAVQPSPVVPFLCPASPGGDHGAGGYPAPPGSPSSGGSAEPRRDDAPPSAPAPDDVR